MKLSELLQRRSQLAERSSDLAAQSAAISRELAAVDAELFGRMKTLVVAIEGAPSSTAPVVSAFAPEPTVDADDVPRRRIVIPRSTRPPKLGPLVVEALRAIGRPADRNEIYDRLVRDGVPIPGKDPKANLSAHLSYADTVLRGPDGLWMLKEWGAAPPQSGEAQKN